MARLAIRLLGPFQVTLDGEPVIGFESDKARALLSYLAVEAERPHRRERLAGLLWPEWPERSARNNLRRTLANVRSVIGDREATPPFLLISRQTIRFNPESDAWVDVTAFTRLLDAGMIEQQAIQNLEEAVDLYGGRFLEGFSVGDSVDFEDWALLKREQLQRQVLEALSRLTGFHEQRNEYERALPAAWRQVELDPWREEAHRQLMRLLALTGQRSAALAQYGACRRVLNDELGVEPSKETQALYHLIQRGELDIPKPTLRTVRGYELQERVGSGGFGIVYRAFQPSVGRAVAIKVILPHFASQPEFIRRFESEAQLVARLEHPHIVPLYDFWRDAGGAYLVMRWLRGGDLHQLLQSGPWSLEAAAQLLDQVASALQVAHSQGVVHRDIKPENILLDEHGNAYLTDFGIAQDLLDVSEATRNGAVAGSLFYISPEQADGQSATPQGDIYSLGIVMFEILTGEHPYSDLTPAAQLMKRLTEPLPRLRERRPDLPPRLEQVINRATARNPLERYPDALAFADAFREAISGTLEGVAVTSPGWVAPEMEISPQLPDFLDGRAEPRERPRSVFVARERELQQLDDFLNAALRGKSCVVFVTGGPGRGKTALMDEFARRAMETHPDLLVASGRCNAYSGIGDPYLPFREVMGMLTGDVQARWAAGAITRDHARRLWGALPIAAQALVDYGASLIDVMLPGKTLLSRAAAACPGGADWFERLGTLVAQSGNGWSNLEQSYLFEQCTNVLRVLADQHPLLLVLDDLQWADPASISLLFHLGRRLDGCRILAICAYRTEEVALGRDGEHHPLEKVLAEFKRSFGDVWLDLSQAEEMEDRRFINAYLDSEPHRLDEAFREALYRHTEGQPLFTVELLRAMQERGNLVQDEEGYWVEGPTLDWETMPPQVEGVIEERIGRLEDELRDILTVASVEGEDFTAQVVARIQEISERQLLRWLSQELERRHRLVRERGELAVGRQRLTRYRFAHAVFQSFLYNRLSAGERRLLHWEVAAVLEELYAGHPEGAAAIAAQLAQHYAGHDEKERYYARLAGEQAAKQYGNAEALHYLGRALELTPETDVAERFSLLLTRETIFAVQGDREAQEQDLADLERLPEVLDDDAGTATRKQAEVALRRARYGNLTGDYRSAAETAQRVILLATSVGDLEGEAKGYLESGRALLQMGQYGKARIQLERSLNLADSIALRDLQASSLRTLGVVSIYEGDLDRARANFEQTLHIYRELGDRLGESASLNNLGVIAESQGDYDAAQAYAERNLRVFREIGSREGEASALNNLGVISQGRGDFASAAGYFERALVIRREIGDRYGEGLALANLGQAATGQGNYTGAEAFLELALQVSREIGHQQLEGLALSLLGYVSVERGSFGTAETLLEQGLNLCRELGNRRSEGYVLLNLGRVFEGRGSIGDAVNHIEQSLLIFREIGDLTGEGYGLLNLGILHRDRGRFTAALELYERALHIFRELGNRDGEGWVLGHLGHILADMGDFATARGNLEQAMNIFGATGARRGESWGLANLGLLAHQCGDDENALTHCQQALGIAEELDNHLVIADALTFLGHALAGIGDTEKADGAYLEALDIRQQLDQPHLATEALAGCARVALVREDLAQALAYGEAILSHLKTNTLYGTEEPFRVYLTCYRILDANQDPCAQDVLKTAYDLLQDRAAEISDDGMRQSFLENVAAHREIMEAWEKIQASLPSRPG